MEETCLSSERDFQWDKCILLQNMEEQMRELIIAILIVFILLIFIFFAIYMMIKEFMANLKSNRLFLTTLFIIMSSLVGTYFLAWIFKNYDIAKQVGSTDA